MPCPSARQVEAKPYVEQANVDVAHTEDAVIHRFRHIADLPRRHEQCSGDLETHCATESGGPASTGRGGVLRSQPELARVDVALSRKNSPFFGVFDVSVW